MSDPRDEPSPVDDPGDDLLELSETAKRFLETPEDDQPSDDASGVEIPQDGDPGR